MASMWRCRCPSHGSEDGTAYVFEGTRANVWAIPCRASPYPTAGGSIEWAADSRGFYYTRYPSPGERPEADLPFYQTDGFTGSGRR